MKVIVTTTINPATEAIRKFEALDNWHLVVIGHLKTLESYALGKGAYVTPEMQEKYDRELSDVIGWNCIQRRNFGLLSARDMNADVVAGVIEDDIPYDNRGTLESAAAALQKRRQIAASRGAIGAYRYDREHQ